MKQILFVFFFYNLMALAQPCLVEISKKEDQWILTVDKKPFFIKGAGGEKHLETLIEAGGNTIRTWGTENAQEVLDNAHAKGIKVMLGLWVQHERHGFDYNNSKLVEAQLENFKLEVQKYKNHPALLIWGIGNEYELNYSNTKVWSAVNDIAKMIHKEDPNHPTSTVTAGTNLEKLGYVMRELTDIDIYGINTYGDIGNVKKVLEEGDFQGSYMITEWGPTGHWEIQKTMWGSSIEQTSTEKALSYLNRYTDNIALETKQCIGSFAFLWGQKQEYTSTWYGLFTEDNKPTEALDVLQYCWSGKYPSNRSPFIENIRLNGNELTKNTIIYPGEKYSIEVQAKDLENDNLKYKWELYQESTDLKTGGDFENKPPLITGRIKGSKSSIIRLKAPFNEGRYRLFVFVSDDKKVAYANVPFYVDANGKANNRIQLKKQEFESLEY